jgi:hypothetical protein
MERSGLARPRTQWLVGMAAVAALMLGACANEATQEAAERSPDPIIAAAGKAGDEDTARVRFDVAFSGAAATMRGEGTFEMVGDSAEVRLEAADPAGATQSLEMMVIDGTTYLRNPQSAAGGPEWYRCEPGSQYVEGLAGSFTDPSEAFALLDSGIDARETGTTEIDGGEGKLYEGTIDLAALADDGEEAGQLQRMGLQQVPVQVVVDEEGRLRRIVLTADLTAAAAAEGATPNPGVMTITIELTEFGVPLDLEEPPADQVADLPVPTPSPVPAGPATTAAA